MSDAETISFTPYTDIDPNVWYQVSEARVDEYKDYDFTSNLQVSDSNTGEVNVWPDNGDLWQFQPASSDSDNARYFLRSSVTGVKKQLGVCYHEDEISNGRTRPCLAESNGSEEQQWDIADWGNGTFRFINVRNGSDYWLDVHRGNPPFMSDEIDTSVYQPAQRWLFSSLSDVNDGGFSTVFTNSPRTGSPTTTTEDSTTTQESATTTDSTFTSSSTSEQTGEADPASSDSDSNGIPAGTAAGIGVGVGLGVVLLAGLAFFLWRRNHKKNGGGNPPPYAPVEAPTEPAAVEIADKGVWGGAYVPDHPSQHSNYSPSPQHLDSFPRVPPSSHPSEMQGSSNMSYELDSQHYR